MATIKTPAAGVSPYQAAAAAPTVLRAGADGATVLANAATAAAAANSLVVVNGQAALNSLISSSQPGVFEGANVTINLEEQNFNTTNQVTSTTNFPSGNTGEIQFNSGANSFASNAYFTYDNSNVITPGIRTDGYFYSNGAPFTGGGNAAIGNFVFTGDVMSIAHANSTLSVTGNGTGNVNITANGNTWNFNSNGNLTFPTGLIIDDEGANTRIYQTSGNLKIKAEDTASLKLGWDEIFPANAGGNVAQIIVNGGGAGQSKNVVVLTGNESTTTYSWRFGNDGNLKLPGNTFAVNYANGSPVVIGVGGGLPLANGTSNINIATANGNVTVTANTGNTWTFATGGNLIFPSGLIIDNESPNTRIYQTSGSLKIRAEETASLKLGWDEFRAPSTGGSLAQIIINGGSTGQPQNVVVFTGNESTTTHSWFFGNDGNLRLPANTFAVNYANGSPVVIGVGGGLPLANGTSNINIATANGNVTVTANATTWSFAADGTTQFPGNLLQPPAGNPLDIKVTNGNAYSTVSLYDGGSQLIIQDNTTGANPAWALFEADLANVNTPQAVVILKPGDTGNEVRWTFDANGNLTTPGASGNISGADVITANVYAFLLGGNITEGTIPAYTSLTGNTIVLTPSGGTSADQQLVIYPTTNPGADANHLHLTSGNLYNTELFLGDDFLYVKLANTGNVVVNTNDLIGNSAQWIFDTGGNLTAPGNISTTGNITGVNNISTGTVTLTNGAVIKDTALYAVAFGQDAGLTSQGQEAVAVGHYAGRTSQGPGGVAIGVVAGNVNQGIEAVAIGAGAGRTDQGIQSIAIGSNAGQTSQGNNSIIINAAQGALDQTVANTFTVAPVRNDVANIAEVVFYNTTSKEITYGNTLSVAGNITGAYFSGNGSGLTGVGAATVPSQNILPAIQTITIADTSGVGNAPSSGQGYANVTVANVISVTEYGVIITSGTSSQKYATGALGNIPGTEKITFTTAQTGAQFTVFAYVTSNAGTFYSNSATGNSGICLLAGTQIALSDGSHKAIEDIVYTDKLLSWDFDRGCYAETTALWIKRSETGGQYNLLTFSDGTTLRTFDQHRIFNKQAGAFTYPMTEATPVGTITMNEHGQEITLTHKQVIEDTIDYYNVITDYHMNLFSDSVLTSCRFNNIYPVVDMKFAKDSRTPRTRAEFTNIPDRFFHGLRLAEQTADVETVEWYVNRLVATEVSTQADLVS